MATSLTAGITPSLRLTDARSVGGGSSARSPRRLRSRSLNWAAGAVLVALASLTALSALAQEIRIIGGNCASGVHLVARDAHFADVLKRLSQALDFQLSFESESNPIVTVDVTGTATELVARLATLGNISMTQARNPACAQHHRIVNVWVLPNSPAGSMRTVATSPQARDAQAEQKRKEQEGFDLILKSHGVALAQRVSTEPQPPANGDSGER